MNCSTRFEPRIQVHGSDHGLECRSQHPIALAPTSDCLATSHSQGPPQVELTRKFCQLLVSHQRGAQPRQVALRHLRTAIVYPGAHDEIQDGVAQELQALVVLHRIRVFVQERAVRQCAAQERRIDEAHPQSPRQSAGGSGTKSSFELAKGDLPELRERQAPSLLPIGPLCAPRAMEPGGPSVPDCGLWPYYLTGGRTGTAIRDTMLSLTLGNNAASIERQRHFSERHPTGPRSLGLGRSRRVAVWPRLWAADVQQAFEVSIRGGIRLIDTAEVYGSGRSERFVGEFIRELGSPVFVATKFFPWPWRLTRGSVIRALKASLRRLGLETVDLYQIHNPYSLLSVEYLAEALVDCVEAGLARAVGVSNFDEGQMLRAYSTLARHKVPLSSNQVHYSLLQRTVEKNGLLARCRELGVRLIAYSPLEMGLLTGKYGRGRLPSGSRAIRYAASIGRLQPLLKTMTEIGQDQGGRSHAQVALNWVMCKGALPIPGAKNADQAQENLGSLGWSLTPDQIATLDEASSWDG